MPSTGEPLLVVLGATAVGKTALAIDLARALDGEIVSADSRQIYREMDIGTAKPTPEERAQAVHHLIDVVAPDKDLSLAQYQRLAYDAIADIHCRGKLPLLVGGTGQYITALLEGWSIPEVPPTLALRAELEAQAESGGVEALYARLLALDPQAAEFVEPSNLRRIVRALEVCIETGQPFSAQRGKQPPSYRVMTYGLTMERERLYARADLRVLDMMARGFLDEVRALLDKGYDRRLPSMSGLGYAQLAGHLLDGVPLDEAIRATQTASHRFIRRQYTWFRGHDHAILWHNVDSTARAELIEAAARWLHE
ncbi:MAG: tRNA (adenosine(37)-N6)-dimethylallyltransferase MiaA [Anaerolineae bacterium]|nr:tRNA (adenosine(37)-N6)-dimethylallyltransferase MiaA [Anaerolineae bacterium]